MTASPLERVHWSPPDARPPEWCCLCFAGLPEVPLMVFREDGSAARFCDSCAEHVFAAAGIVP